MLSSIYIDGYRSLEALTIPIEAGLNVLVGPNGGGKTNILSFFEFLSTLARMPVDEAVSNAGGISRVFSRKSGNVYRGNLKCALSGSTDYETAGGYPRKFWYRWEFTIAAINNVEDIIFQDQRLYISCSGKPYKYENSDIVISTSFNEKETKLKIERIIVSKTQTLLKSMMTSGILNSYDNYVSSEEASRIFRFGARFLDLSRMPIVRSFQQSGSISRKIISDISGGETFNLSPEACKAAEDASRPPSIDKNGSGLASTLHRLYRDNQLFGPNIWPGRRVLLDNVKIRSRIKSYVSLISDEITDLKTEKDVIDNKISVQLRIDERDGETWFPLAQCSDGTVKWVALVTKILTSDTGFSLEEPENFLHPNAQRELVSVIRNEMLAKSKRSYIFLTTHSESLLNHTKPEELLLVWMDEGTTRIKKIENPEIIQDEINRTGFGLSYYYVTGAVDIA